MSDEQGSRATFQRAMRGDGEIERRLCAKFYNRPLAMHEAVATAIGFGSVERSDGDDDRYGMVLQGAAIVPVHGPLLQRGDWLTELFGMSSYDMIRANFEAAMHDDDVKAIVLDIDSPGGEVAGCFDLVDAIFEARGSKPIHAILSENAYSAAYAIASAADRIIVPRTGGTGSIGVVCMHADFSQALTKAGIVVTLVRSDPEKYEGNQYEPLGKDALGRLQADIDTSGDLFKETVARNRGLTFAKVAATKAGTYQGAAGIDVGLVDAVMAPDAAFRALLHLID